LRQNRTIQKDIALLLLLAFTISIAPKTYFHDLVADHKDFSECHQLHHSTVLHHQGFNCHFDDLVVSAPFLLQAEPQLNAAEVCFDITQTSFYSFHLSSSSHHKETRGPPSA